MGQIDLSDPFHSIMAPPVHETAEERLTRQDAEAKAKQVSDKIDEILKKEKEARRKDNVIRILLLGQAESGKSTTLKNFQIRYSNALWKKERISWRPVIQLNLLTAVITIIDAIQSEMDDEADDRPPTASTVSSNEAGSTMVYFEEDFVVDYDPTSLNPSHQLLRKRLGPLRDVEKDLRQRLGAATVEDRGQYGRRDDAGGGEVFVFKRDYAVTRLQDIFGTNGEDLGRPTSRDGERDSSTEVIARCADDISALWKDTAVRAMIIKRKMKLPDSTGYFFANLRRLVDRDYIPSDEDVLHARLRTLGVQEHHIHFGPEDQDTTIEHGRDWIFYDVGGSRMTRLIWAPYFDNVNAIIFLAPISCFDEQLLEDRTVNRLEDSLNLWKNVCNNKILQLATLIVFLNKYDILKRKLRSGILMNKYMTSFGDRPNEPHVVAGYLKAKFKRICEESTRNRNIYLFSTSVTEAKKTASMLQTVRDSILRHLLRSADFM